MNRIASHGLVTRWPDFVASLACAGTLAATSGALAQSSRLVTLPIAVHVAEVDGHPVVDTRFVADRIERANTIYAAYGVAFRVQSTRALAVSHAIMDNRADRDALATEVTRGAIDLFVVQSLRDVDEPTRMRRGVHWHAAAQPSTQPTPHAAAHFVILSSIAGLDVLAHELGHYLGNRDHSEVPGNLMSYLLGPALPVLDEAQQGKLARAVRGYLRRRELLPIATPEAALQPPGQAAAVQRHAPSAHTATVVPQPPQAGAVAPGAHGVPALGKPSGHPELAPP